MDSPQNNYATQVKKWGPTANLGIRVDAEDYELYQNRPYYVRKYVREVLRAVFKRAVRAESENIAVAFQEPVDIKLNIKHEYTTPDIIKLSKKLKELEEHLEQEIAQRLSCEEEKQELQKQLEQLSQKRQEEEAKDIQIKKIESELARAKEAVLELVSLLDIATACIEDIEIKNTFLNRLNKIVNQYGTPKPNPVLEKLKSKCKTK